jgi:hypothetical protein
MNTTNDNQNTTYPSYIVETAFRLWEQIEALSTLLWNAFDEEFIEIGDRKAIEIEQRRSDAEDEMPF